MLIQVNVSVEQLLLAGGIILLLLICRRLFVLDSLNHRLKRTTQLTDVIQELLEAIATIPTILDRRKDGPFSAHTREVAAKSRSDLANLRESFLEALPSTKILRSTSVLVAGVVELIHIAVIPPVVEVLRQEEQESELSKNEAATLLAQIEQHLRSLPITQSEAQKVLEPLIEAVQQALHKH